MAAHGEGAENASQGCYAHGCDTPHTTHIRRGRFHVGTTNGLCLCLLIDTGAEMNVAGVGYIEALELMVADSAGVGGGSPSPPR